MKKYQSLRPQKTTTTQGAGPNGIAFAPPIQRKVDGKSTLEELRPIYESKVGGEIPELLVAPFEKLLAEEKDYPFQEAFELAMERAMDNNEDEVQFHTIEVYVPSLVKQLDPTQHRPDLVSFDGSQIKQTEKEDHGGLHYRQDSLQDIMTSNLKEDASKVKDIFFEILDSEAPITTGDGRHRIAAYHAMGKEWIRASVTKKQKEQLQKRKIEVRELKA